MAGSLVAAQGTGLALRACLLEWRAAGKFGRQPVAWEISGWLKWARGNIVLMKYEAQNNNFRNDIDCRPKQRQGGRICTEFA